MFGDRVRSIGAGEAYQMVESGQARLISSRRCPTVVIQLNVVRSSDRSQNQSSITMGEMQANAGVIGGTPRPDRVRVRRRPDGSTERRELDANFSFRSQEKIRQWPHIGDRKSVRVGPLGVERVRIMTADNAEALRFAF